MSDPYGNNPYGNDPYSKPPQGDQGQPAPNPYSPPAQPGGGAYGNAGGGGYGGGYGGGGGYPGGPDPSAPSTDGLSIAALVLSFLCCLAPIGVILGFVGLGRTKNGQRKGRGLAIAAIVIGIVMTLICAAALAAIFFFAGKVVTPDNAEVGQCVSIDKKDNTIFLYEEDCDSEHDGEVVGVAEVTADNIDDIKESMAGFCVEIIDDADLAKLTEYLTDINAVTEDPDDIEKGDHILCYVEADLSEPLL